MTNVLKISKFEPGVIQQLEGIFDQLCYIERELEGPALDYLDQAARKLEDAISAIKHFDRLEHKRDRHAGELELIEDQGSER